MLYRFLAFLYLSFFLITCSITSFVIFRTSSNTGMPGNRLLRIRTANGFYLAEGDRLYPGGVRGPVQACRFPEKGSDNALISPPPNRSSSYPVALVTSPATMRALRGLHSSSRYLQVSQRWVLCGGVPEQLFSERLPMPAPDYSLSPAPLSKCKIFPRKYLSPDRPL